MSSPDVSLYVGSVVSIMFVKLVGSKSVTLVGTDLDRTGVGRGPPALGGGVSSRSSITGLIQTILVSTRLPYP